LFVLEKVYEKLTFVKWIHTCRQGSFTGRALDLCILWESGGGVELQKPCAKSACVLSPVLERLQLLNFVLCHHCFDACGWV